ncbi:DUF3040 domain-containing protein [Streptomyces collinus]|uniref:Uncharacterized protein n=1 Tax=Streptomyces collinus (strain DSM 40733 / Tue 365) TaxID=1214242 RepID=S5VH81_STRC3|nr:DUF3040 domain-containing protein [Streptomyces collinus]AGS67810.1 hypothetical protein B446_04910 [Streptomyces collinus Tu 365]
MNDWETPDDVRLSPRERVALLIIEAELRQDRRLAHRMRATPGRSRLRRGPWLLLAFLLLGCASVFTAVVGIQTSDPSLLWCFALLWPLTLLQGFRLLCRATRRRPPSGGVSPWL